MEKIVKAFGTGFPHYKNTYFIRKKIHENLKNSRLCIIITFVLKEISGKQ